jgi:hypothetical protein
MLQEAPKTQKGSRGIAVTLLGLIAALMMDTVVAPRLLAGWTGFRFLPAAVVLAGMWRGKWRGVWAGWVGAFLETCLSAEPVGLAMLRLGVAGFAAGFFKGILDLRVPWLTALLLMALIVLEDLAGGIAAWFVLDVPLSLNVWGILATALAAGGFLRWAAREREGF